MTKTSPFLTGFSALLCGRPKTKTQVLLAQKRRALLEGGVDIAQQFRDEIDPELLERFSETERVRAYPHPLTFWAFLLQTASDDASCHAAVSNVQTWARQDGLPVPSEATGAYCQARYALPEEMLREVNRSLCRQLEACLPEASTWRGLRPKAEDGTTAQMPDTEENRATWPYPAGQAPGCGFPMVRLGGLIDLSHGGLSEFAQNTMNESEIQGHFELAEAHLSPGDLHIGDRLYSSYEAVARLQQQGVEFLGRNHQARKIDFRKGRKISPNQRLIEWQKPQQKPKGCRLSEEEWEALPEVLMMRLIRCSGPDRQGRRSVRYLVTTLLDEAKYPKEEIASLYFHRWEIEVRFRDIKTTLGMEMLRTKKPEMIRKELLMNMIVYNLMRLLMLKAGVSHGVNHRRLSFRGTQQVIQSCRELFIGVGKRPRVREREVRYMRERLAEREVAARPGRNEPRRVKRRPKCTRWLQRPRHEYFEHFRTDDPIPKILDQPA